MSKITSQFQTKFISKCKQGTTLINNHKSCLNVAHRSPFEKRHLSIFAQTAVGKIFQVFWSQTAELMKQTETAWFLGFCFFFKARKTEVLALGRHPVADEYTAQTSTEGPSRPPAPLFTDTNSFETWSFPSKLVQAQIDGW